jgi:8-oxo-dGTP diphosphatase
MSTLTVDVVLLTLKEGRLHVGLFKREHEPFAGMLALPGACIDEAKDGNAQAAATRVLREKTGLASLYLEELGTFSGPKRDPRGWSLTVVYYALVPMHLLEPTIRLYPADRLPKLAFDHKAIIKAAVIRVRSKAGYSSLPVYLCPEKFTLSELQATYEAIIGEPLNKANFRRKVDDLGVLDELAGEYRSTGNSRPAQLYRLKSEFSDVLSVRERGI